MGITVVAASGDQGATDGSGGVLVVGFPVSSPFVTGRGGTRMILANGRTATETVCNANAIGKGATGGGIGEVFARPAP